MKTLDFSILEPGQETRLRQIIMALLEDGRVRVIDPDRLLHSRTKFPLWDGLFILHRWIIDHVRLDSKSNEDWNRVIRWADGHKLVPAYDHGVTKTNADFTLTLMRGDEILKLWDETNPK